MTRSRSEATATAVGALSGLAGVALLTAPQRIGEAVGLVDRGHARLVGAVDLVLAAGLLGARPRWPWLAARAVSNPFIAALAIESAVGTDRRRPAVAFGSVLLLATVGDLVATAALRRDGA